MDRPGRRRSIPRRGSAAAPLSSAHLGSGRRGGRSPGKRVIGACGTVKVWRAALLDVHSLHQESARKLLRRRSESPSRRSASTAAWVFLQTGTALASNLRPFAVRVMRRPRPSAGSGVILSRPRRRKGLRAAVKVVRSIASSEAAAAIPGGFGRFRDINRENCPFVRPSGRSASSKRRASALAARCT